MMKQIEVRFAQSERGLLLGFLFGAIMLAGCDSGEPAANTARPAVAPAAAPATTSGDAKKAKGDTTSRRQHQKEQVGATK